MSKIESFEKWIMHNTPVIPKLYWDVYSSEQSLKNLWKSISGLKDYSDKQTEQINENTENIARKIDEIGIQDQIDSEVLRAEKAEKELSDKISAEELRAKAAEEANANAIADEAARAKAAEEANANAIADEAARAKAAEEANANAIADEAARAKAAEEANLINSMNLSNIKPISRFSMQINGNRFSTQSVCYVNEDVCFVYVENDDLKKSYLVIAKSDNSYTLVEIEKFMGHGGTMFFDERTNFLYIANSADSIIYRTLFNNNTNSFSSFEAFNSYGGGGYAISKFDENSYIVTYNKSVKDNVEIVDLQTKETIKSFTVDYGEEDKFDQYINQFSKTIKIFNKYYTIKGSSNTSRLKIYDTENNEFISFIDIPAYSNFVFIGEFEDISFDPKGSGNFYISAQDLQTSSLVNKTGFCFFGNIFKKQYPQINFNQDSGIFYIHAVDDEDYMFPHSDSGNDITSSNPIKIKYLQDIDTISSIYKCHLELFIDQDIEDSIIYINNNSSILINTNNFKLKSIYAYGSNIVIQNPQVMLANGGTYNFFRCNIKIGATLSSDDISSTSNKIEDCVLYSNQTTINSFKEKSNWLRSIGVIGV